MDLSLWNFIWQWDILDLQWLTNLGADCCSVETLPFTVTSSVDWSPPHPAAHSSAQNKAPKITNPVKMSGRKKLFFFKSIFGRQQDFFKEVILKDVSKLDFCGMCSCQHHLLLFCCCCFSYCCFVPAPFKPDGI